MDVTVQDICSGKDNHTLLPNVVRVGLSAGMRDHLAGIWDGAICSRSGITINLVGPFVITCESHSHSLGWQYPIIKEPDELR